MNLREFVEEAIVDITTGIIDAKNKSDYDIRFSDSTDKRTIEFDVAVTAEDKGITGNSLGIKVLGFNAGTEGTINTKNSTVSRIMFGVEINPLNKTEQRRWETKMRSQYIKSNQTKEVNPAL